MKTYTVDGSRIKNKQDFFTELGHVVNGDNGYFGNNLDALADCLRGGFGTPDTELFRFTITHTDEVCSTLGIKLYNEIIDVFAVSDIPLDT